MGASVRLGVIGAGRWGANYIRTIHGVPGTVLAAVSSRNPRTPELAGAGVAIEQDWHALLDPARIDGVILAVPPALHPEVSIAALDAGVPVLIEKPLALDAASARRIAARAAGRPVLAMVGHTHLFNPAFRRLKQLLPSLGPLRALHGEAGNTYPPQAGVSVLWDWGPHDLGMFLELTGSAPTAATARVVDRSPAGNETVELDLTFPGGVAASARMSDMVSKRRRLRAECSGGALVYDDLAAEKLTLQRAGESSASPVAVDYRPPLTIVVEEFAAAIRDGVRHSPSLDLGVQVVEILEKASRA